MFDERVWDLDVNRKHIVEGVNHVKTLTAATDQMSNEVMSALKMYWTGKGMIMTRNE